MWNKSSISSLLFVCKLCFLAYFLTFLWLQSLLLTHLKMPLTPGYDFIFSVQRGWSNSTPLRLTHSSRYWVKLIALSTASRSIWPSRTSCKWKQRSSLT
jgi:hypothetical protein